jgi:hypothetical protein
LDESIAWQQQQQQSLRDRIEEAGDVYVERKILRLAAVSARCYAVCVLPPDSFAPHAGHAWQFPIISVSS